MKLVHDILKMAVVFLNLVVPKQLKAKLDFWQNTHQNVKKIHTAFDDGKNLVLAWMEFQAGKTAIKIYNIFESFKGYVDYESRDLNEGEKLFLAFHFFCGSNRQTLKQTIERYEKEFKDSKMVQGCIKSDIPFAIGIGHNDCLGKFLKSSHSKDNGKPSMLFYTNLTQSDEPGFVYFYRDQIEHMLKKFKGVKICTNMDEIDQYKRQDGYIHKFVEEILQLDLVSGASPYNQTLLCITATPSDNASFIKELNNMGTEHAWAQLALSTPKDYYSFMDMINRQKFLDYEVVFKQVKGEFKDDDITESELHHETIRRFVRSLAGEWSKKGGSLVLRHPDRCPASQQELKSLLEDEIHSQLPQSDLKTLQVDMKNPEDKERFLKELNSNNQNSHSSVLAAKGIPGFNQSKSLTLVLLVNMFSRGESVKCDNIFAWIEPWKSTSSCWTSNLQAMARVLGIGKSSCDHYLIGSKFLVENYLRAAFESFKRGDLEKFADLRSSFHKTTSKPVGQYKTFLVNPTDTNYTSHYNKKKPLKMSNRAKSNRDEKTPDERFYETYCIGGITNGRSLFPQSQGGEYNCQYNGVAAMAIELDGPSPNCPAKLVNLMNAHKGMHVVQVWSQAMVREYEDKGVSTLPESKAKGTMLHPVILEEINKAV